MPTYKMSEQIDATANASVNGAAPALNFKATKAALTSSSTSSRVAQLRVIDDKILQKGMAQNFSVILLPINLALKPETLLTMCP